MSKLQEHVVCKKEFKLSAVERCSYAMKFLYMWVKAIIEFTNRWNETEPIRAHLRFTKKLLDQR
jgi:dynein heavy chain